MQENDIDEIELPEIDENAPQIIKTIGEQGEEVFMKLQEVVNVGGQDYALLSLVEEDTLPQSNTESDELVLMKMHRTENECTFEVISDDKEFKFVTEALSETEDDEEDDDDDDDEDEEQDEDDDEDN